MRLRYLFVFIIGFSLINISCTDHKYDRDKQPAPDTSEKPVTINKTASPDTLTQQKPTAAVQAKYQYPDDNGVGPVKDVDESTTIDSKLVAQGKNIFNTKCAPCHQMDNRLVGPPLRNITKKNTPVFIMNYLLNTTEMQKKDPILKKLVDEYKIVMPDQQLTKQDARSVLEYFRSEEK